MTKLIKLIIVLKYYLMSVCSNSKIIAKTITKNNNLKSFANLPWFLEKRITIKNEGIFSMPKDLFKSFSETKFKANNLVMKRCSFSIFLYRILEAIGYEPELLIIINTFSVKSLCYFKHKENIIVFDGYNYKKFNLINEIKHEYKAKDIYCYKL